MTILNMSRHLLDNSIRRRWKSCVLKCCNSPIQQEHSYVPKHLPPSYQQISVTVVTEFVRWNEEAISRCTLFSSRPTTLAACVKSVFTCLLDESNQYITDGLERARESLNEAAALRERFVIGTSVSRRVAAAAASAV
ncbi:exocyst complex component SEC10b-like [Magnolia sinica]|uniref:exocyst complex component SEC10b-like n=1 Tax=Magnolia sinica TaxID=86752 RepID=UPI00265B00F0|nr:exocyst complex component SEC10b-like [Magnolia sinica]